MSAHFASRVAGLFKDKHGEGKWELFLRKTRAPREASTTSSEELPAQRRRRRRRREYHPKVPSRNVCWLIEEHNESRKREKREALGKEKNERKGTSSLKGGGKKTNCTENEKLNKAEEKEGKEGHGPRKIFMGLGKAGA